MYDKINEAPDWQNILFSSLQSFANDNFRVVQKMEIVFEKF